MSDFNYIEEANSTCSEKFFGEAVNLIPFIFAVGDAVKTIEILDNYKKLLYYGKGLENVLGVKIEGKGQTCKIFEEENVKHLIHGILGKATEAGELLEALLNYFETKKFNEVNIVEEVGDSFWYDALICRELGYTFEDIQQLNIAKLRKRYPNKFNTKDAIERNIEEELKVLEGKS